MSDARPPNRTSALQLDGTDAVAESPPTTPSRPTNATTAPAASRNGNVMQMTPECGKTTLSMGSPIMMQAIASSDIEINEVRPQHSKLVGGKVREKLVLIRYRWWHVYSRI